MSVSLSNLLKNLGLLSASLLLTLGLAEVLLRATGYRPALADPAMYVAGDDELLPYRMQPHFEGYYMGQFVRLDGQGYRVVPADSSTPYEQKVLLLGDSVVFGHGLAEDHTPSAQLQRLFAAKRQRVRVQNVAVSGYTTWNELAALEDYLASYEADAVVLIFLENDITFNHNQLRVADGEFGNLGGSRWHRFTQQVYRNVYLSYLMRNAVELIARSLGSDASEPARQPEPAGGTHRLVAHADRNSDSPLHLLDTDALAHALEGLEKIQALCERRGIDFRVGIYRDVTYYEAPDAVRRYEDELSATLAERGIASFVVGSHVEQLPESSARISWNDPHPTAAAVGYFVKDIKQALDPVLAGEHPRIPPITNSDR